MIGLRNSTLGLWGIVLLLLVAIIVTVAGFWWIEQGRLSGMEGYAALEKEWNRAARLEQTLANRREMIRRHPMAAKIIFFLGGMNPLFGAPTPREVLSRFTPEDKPTVDIATLAWNTLHAGRDQDTSEAAEIADMLHRRVRNVEKETRFCMMALILSFLSLIAVCALSVWSLVRFHKFLSKFKAPGGIFLPGGGPRVAIKGREFRVSWWSPSLKLASPLSVFLDKDIRSALPRSEIKGTVLWILKLLKAYQDTPASPNLAGHEGGVGGLLRHSLNVGAEMLRRAKQEGRNDVSPREALVVGLAHDIGKIISYRNKKGGMHDNLSAFLLKWSRAFHKEFDEATRSKILAAVGFHHDPERLPVNQPWRAANRLLKLLVGADRYHAMKEIKRLNKRGETVKKGDGNDDEEVLADLLRDITVREGEVDKNRGVFWMPEVTLRRKWLRKTKGDPEKVRTGTPAKGPPASWDALLDKLKNIGVLHETAATAPRGLFDVERDGERMRFRVPLRLDKMKGIEKENAEEKSVTVLGPSLVEREEGHARDAGEEK